MCPLDTILKQGRKKIDCGMQDALIDNTSTDTEKCNKYDVKEESDNDSCLKLI